MTLVEDSIFKRSIFKCSDAVTIELAVSIQLSLLVLDSLQLGHLWEVDHSFFLNQHGSRCGHVLSTLLMELVVEVYHRNDQSLTNISVDLHCSED